MKSYDLEQQRKESKEFLDTLTPRDQRMMFAVLTMVHMVDSKEQLDNHTEALLTTARAFVSVRRAEISAYGRAEHSPALWC